jgi:diketogulonate reductase-like aldo/keto reductase
MLELGNDPYLIENTNQIKKDYEDLVGICEALRTAHLDISSRNMVLEWIQRLQLTDDQLEESRKQLQRQADDLVQIHKEKAAEVGRMLSVAQSTMKNIDEAIDTVREIGH